MYALLISGRCPFLLDCELEALMDACDASFRMCRNGWFRQEFLMERNATDQVLEADWELYGLSLGKSPILVGKAAGYSGLEPWIQVSADAATPKESVRIRILQPCIYDLSRLYVRSFIHTLTYMNPLSPHSRLFLVSP